MNGTTRTARPAVAGLLAAALASAWLLAGPLARTADAAVLGVTSEAELRAAIIDINDNQCGTGPHTIEISASFVFSTSGDPVYTCNDNLTIESVSPDHWTIEGTSVFDTRFLDALASTGTITINELTIVGFEHTTIGDSSIGEGGAIASGGNVSVSDSVFSTNGVRALGNTTEVYGGAISAAGDVLIDTSTFADNSLNTLGATDSIASGGAIDATGTVTIIDSTFTSNLAYVTGAGSTADGGAFFAGSGATVDGSIFTSNSAQGADIGSGGAIVVSGGTLDVTDTSFTTNFAYAPDYADGGAISSDVDVTVTDSTFTGNYASGGGAAGFGGAVWGDTIVTVDTSIFTDNYASSPDGGLAGGGAIFATFIAEVTDSTFTANEAGSTSTTDAFAFGGAIYGDFAVAVVGSTFDNNLVHSLATDTANSVGGAIFANDSILAYDSTFTANEADGNGTTVDNLGGAIAGPDVFVIQSTLVGNEAATGSQVLAITLESYGSVFALPVGPGTNCATLGGTTSQGYNFDDDESCFPTSGTDIGSGADPMLAPLANFGGPTKTMDPLPGSPLIDAITDSSCEDVPLTELGITPPADQRGVLRTVGSCDIGAVEALAPVIFTVVTSNGTITGTVTQALSVQNVTWTDTASVTPVPPAGLSLPYGVFGFEIVVPADGWSVGIKLDLPAPVNQFWKLQSGAWTHITTATISGTEITYGLTDGSGGDEDGTANSLIVDPAGPGIFALFTG